MAGDEYIPTSGTRWNFDDAEAMLIYEIKKQFVSNLRAWKLEEAFWDYFTLTTESDALFDDDEQTNTEKNEEDLSKLRDTYNLKETPDAKEKGEYWMKLRKFYKQACRILKAHGLYMTEIAEGADDET